MPALCGAGDRRCDLQSAVECRAGSDHEQRAIDLVAGDRSTLRAVQPSRAQLLGGDVLQGPRYIWCNFASSSKDRIEQAKQDWTTGRFAAVPEEHEFIPLPD